MRVLHLSYGCRGQNCQSYHLHGLMCPQNTNILHPVCPLPEAGCLWDTASLRCFFTKIHSTPEQAPFLVGRSNPDVAKHLGLVPHCHLIMAFLRNKSIFNSAPGFLGHIWFSWVQPRWRCCCGFLQGCSWGNRARGTSLIPRNPWDTREVLLQND